MKSSKSNMVKFISTALLTLFFLRRCTDHGLVHRTDSSLRFRINYVPDQWNRHHENGDGDDLFCNSFHVASFRDALHVINNLLGQPRDVENQYQVINQHPRQNLGTQDCNYVLELILADSPGFIRVGHLKQVVANFTGGRLVSCRAFRCNTEN